VSITNSYCDPLGIQVPRLEAVRNHPQATTFALLIVALLERGAPMTLREVATRFEQAGIAPAEDALYKLQRCRPARPPVWRDGDQYGLDSHDADLDLRVFMLGLRPPRVARPAVPRPQPAPLPESDVRLTPAELDEAWKDAHLFSWSRQRLVLAALDAHGTPLRPDDVIALIAARTQWHGLTADAAKFKQARSAVEIQGDGRWGIAPGNDALVAARKAVRERLAMVRRWARTAVDPQEVQARQRALEAERAVRAGELLKLRRVIVHGFPAAKPAAVVLLDVAARTIDTFVGEELSTVTRRLDEYDVIAALDVRALLRAVNYQPGRRRLADLGPPQKTKQLNKRGRTLKITPELLIQGSCGISRPLGDPGKLQSYLREDDDTRLRRRLEADAKSLYAFYQYGRLHGAVRLRWGFLDERLPAPWVHRDEPTLYTLKSQALELGIPLQIVEGSAPGWADPWSRARQCTVRKEPSGWQTYLVGDDGTFIDDADVQLARVAAVVH
jgi:hypothetical protein